MQSVVGEPVTKEQIIKAGLTMQKLQVPPRKVIKIPWSNVHLMTEILAEMIKGKAGVVDIIGVCRGGLIPATILSHMLGANLHVVEAKSYDRLKLQRADVEVQRTSGLYGLDPQTTVIVDDVIDSMRTHNALRHHGLNYRYAALINKHPSFAGSFVMQVPQECWVHFPWEID